MQINISKLINYFIVANVFGFPMVVVLNLYMGFSTSVGSIVFRALILVSSILLIANAIKIKKQISIQSKLLIFFWIMYSVRLIYDLSFRQLYLNTQHYDSENLIYLIAFFGIFTPMIAIIMNAKFIEFNSLSKLCLQVSFIQCVLVILGLYKLFGTNITKIAQQRHLFSEAILGDNITGGSPLNPILVSRCGALLILLIVSNFLFQKNHLKPLVKFTAIPLGITLVILGGSRGPLITCLFVLFVMYFLFLYKNRLNTAKIIKQLLIVFLVFYTLYFLYEMFSERIGIVERLNHSENTIDSGRTDHWFSAINQFIDNPFFGDQIFDKHLWIYPHNLVLEAFMALGVVGGILFMYLIFKSVMKYKQFLKYRLKSFSVYIIFIVFFMFGMSSGGLYNSIEFWIALTLISILDVNFKTKLKA